MKDTMKNKTAQANTNQSVISEENGWKPLTMEETISLEEYIRQYATPKDTEYHNLFLSEQVLGRYLRELMHYEKDVTVINNSLDLSRVIHAKEKLIDLLFILNEYRYEQHISSNVVLLLAQQAYEEIKAEVKIHD